SREGVAVFVARTARSRHQFLKGNPDDVVWRGLVEADPAGNPHIEEAHRTDTGNGAEKGEISDTAAEHFPANGTAGRFALSLPGGQAETTARLPNHHSSTVNGQQYRGPT